ncbi:pyridoxal phosphate-dependent transferase [Russula earlei]|uniref:Pyridoxal phosphate-dependent transferase n=1 Tax=Russula earlei TaxID=71964 RepID=A0ACC0UCS6_9AGAM|nr:pyridoxal phosphate-dependent transferase [Russula earlei]
MLRFWTRPLRPTLTSFSRTVTSQSTLEFNRALYAPLSELDPVVQNIIDKETWRQYSGLELIASANLTSRATMEANGSFLTNKLSEGLPNARYYGGNDDELEILCRERALQAFHLDPVIWGVNVQPYSVLQPQDRLMGLGLPDGGHLTHGYYTAKKKMTASSIYFRSFPYAVDPGTQLIDYVGLASQVHIFKPRLIICGASAYPRDWDYETLRKIADEHGGYLMADIAHTSGLVAAQELADPFKYCDVTLRGPHAGLVFFRKDGEARKDLEKCVNDAVFPACPGAFHNNTIAGIATALLQAAQPSWKAYAQQVIKNAKALADELLKHGYKLQTGGTDNHFVLWDLRPLKLTGSKFGDLNAVSGDSSAQVPGGSRIGTAALTSRDMQEEDLRTVANFLHRAVQLSLLVQKESGSKLLKDFVRAATVHEEGKFGAQKVAELRREVREFARRWPLPESRDRSRGHGGLRRMIDSSEVSEATKDSTLWAGGGRK